MPANSDRTFSVGSGSGSAWHGQSQTTLPYSPRQRGWNPDEQNPDLYASGVAVTSLPPSSSRGRAAR